MKTNWDKLPVCGLTQDWRDKGAQLADRQQSRSMYPFSAIVGQDSMKLGLILNAVNPSVGGLLIRGEKGTAKSTAVRALASVLPAIEVAAGCPYSCDPKDTKTVCDYRRNNGIAAKKRRVRVVEFPLNATEEMVVGGLDFSASIRQGVRAFQPGLVARANRGILYIDEVNLLADHLVDAILDVSASGENIIQREGISHSHPGRFILVGTMNPEEGELRPQLLDRFGLCVNIEGIRDAEARVEIMARRLGFDNDPAGFSDDWAEESARISTRIKAAQVRCAETTADRSILQQIAAACLKLGVDGHRADIVTLKTSRALAAYEGRTNVTHEDVLAAAELALPHRLRKTPFDGVATEVEAQIRAALS